jgi:hypothetical protein
MTELSEKALFLHVCVPGQEPGAKNLSSSQSVQFASPKMNLK